MLEDLSPEETATIIGCLQFSSYCDEYIVRQGEDGDRMFIILEVRAREPARCRRPSAPSPAPSQGEAVVTERVRAEETEGEHTEHVDSRRRQRELVRLYEVRGIRWQDKAPRVAVSASP